MISYINAKNTSEEGATARSTKKRADAQRILARMARSFGGLETGVEPTTFQCILTRNYEMTLKKKPGPPNLFKNNYPV
jgi:hypothetical protein